MHQKKRERRRLSVSTIAFVLAIAIVATLPFVTTVVNTTMARYVAQATALPTAHVARWQVEYTQQPATNVRHENITVFHTHVTATHAAPTAVLSRNAALHSGPTTRSFTIANNSQVTADVYISLRYALEDDETPTATSPTVANSAHSHGAHALQVNAGAVQTLGGDVFRHQYETSGTYTINIQATNRALPHFAIRWYRVFFDALQVD